MAHEKVRREHREEVALLGELSRLGGRQAVLNKQVAMVKEIGDPLVDAKVRLIIFLERAS